MDNDAPETVRRLIRAARNDEVLLEVHVAVVLPEGATSHLAVEPQQKTIRPALDAYALALTPDGLALVAPRVLVLSFRYLCFTTPAVQLVLQCQPAVRKFHRNCARHMF